MKCTRCNIELNIYARECPWCGTAVSDIIKEEKLRDELKAGLKEPKNVYLQQPQESTNSVKNYSEYRPMLWYKILIYFVLFLMAFRSLISGYVQITGLAHDIANGGVRTKILYSQYPYLRWLDIVGGISWFAFSFTCIYTRQKLKNYSKIAPYLIQNLFLFEPIYKVVYVLIGSELGTNRQSQLFNINFLLNSLFCFILVMIHKEYFSKRIHLFSNK